MAGGTIRSHRKLIHRESSRASVLNHSGGHAVLHSIAEYKCLLTTLSLLSRGTLYDGVGSVKGHVEFASRRGLFFSSPERNSSLSFIRPRLARESGGGFWFHQPSIRSLTPDHDSFFRRRDRSREQGAQSG